MNTIFGESLQVKHALGLKEIKGVQKAINQES